MSYLSFLYDVVKNDLEYEELMDKAVEKYLDSIDYDPELKVIVARSADEFDQKESIEGKGYTLKSITYHKSLKVAIMIFEKNQSEFL